MTAPRKNQDKTRLSEKKPAGAKAEINADKTELIDDELKKVTGGGKTIAADDWKAG